MAVVLAAQVEAGQGAVVGRVVWPDAEWVRDVDSAALSLAVSARPRRRQCCLSYGYGRE